MSYSHFTNVSKITKAVRFELLPERETAETIHKFGFLESDKRRIEDSNIVKTLIDDCHRTYINEKLSALSLEWDQLERAYDALNETKSKENRKIVSDCSAFYRKQITEHLTKGKEHKKLFCSAVFEDEIPKEIERQNREDKQELEDVLMSFDGYTTYFTSFFDKREHLYSEEDKQGTIAYRIVNENFPKFLDAMRIYSLAEADYHDAMETAYVLLQEHIPVFSGQSLNEIFTLSFFNNLLTAEGIAAFNKIINGMQIGEDVMLKGLNQALREAADKNNSRAFRLPMLYKQVLVSDTSLNFIHQSINNDEECMDSLESLFSMYETGEFFSDIIEFFRYNASFYPQDEIYIRKNYIHTVSHAIFGYHQTITSAMYEYKEKQYGNAKLKKKDKAAIEKWMKREAVPVSDINAALSDKVKNISDYYNLIAEQAELIQNLAAELKNKLESKRKAGDAIRNDREFVSYIKMLLEESIKIPSMMKVFIVNDAEDMKNDFYQHFDGFYESAVLARKVYNQVEKYIKRKPFSTEKYQLNFENPMLLTGWSQSVLRYKGGMILRKDKSYYLLIANKLAKGRVDLLLDEGTEDGGYEAFIINFMQKSSNFVPKVAFTKDVIAHFEEQGNDEDYIHDSSKVDYPIRITRELYELRKSKKYTTQYAADSGDTEGFRKALNQWISFHAEVLLKHKSTSKFNFSEIADLDETGNVIMKAEFSNLKEFFDKADSCMYSISSTNLAEETVHSKVESGEVLLFKINSRPLSYYQMYDDYKLKDLNAMYFLSLFTKTNMQKANNRLNGDAKIFYRKASLEKIVEHKKGTMLLNKNTVDGVPLPGNVYLELYAYLNKQSDSLSAEATAYLPRISAHEATETITKDARYGKDKFLVSFTITCNANVEGNASSILTVFNESINEHIRTSDTKILSVTRGENNSLLNAVLIDMDGKILEQKNFDVINGQNVFLKLRKKVAENLENQKNWKDITSIKESQEGYVSQVINDIISMAIDNNAVICFADIRNLKSKGHNAMMSDDTYRLLMKSVQSKLVYHVADKKAYLDNPKDTALQLCFETEDKYVSTQNGIVFFATYSYNKVDVNTGFTNLLSIKDISRNTTTKRAFFETLDELEYDKLQDCFIFTVDYGKYDTFVPSDAVWEIASAKEKRFIDKGGRGIRKYPTKEIKEALKMKGIDIESRTLLQDVLEVSADRENADFYNELWQAFVSSVLLNQMSEDFSTLHIQSPVLGDNGKYFDTQNSDILNADFAAAYAVALKGLLMVSEIKNGGQKASRVTAEEWLNALHYSDLEKK